MLIVFEASRNPNVIIFFLSVGSRTSATPSLHFVLQAEGGECVDQVIRGCFNNGTCVAPDVCECAEVNAHVEHRPRSMDRR